MENTRFIQGMEQLKAIDDKGGENVIKSLEDIAPDLGKFIVEFAFGDIYTRAGLTTEEREMITLSSLLTAGGCEPQLKETNLFNRVWIAKPNGRLWNSLYHRFLSFKLTCEQ